MRSRAIVPRLRDEHGYRRYILRPMKTLELNTTSLIRTFGCGALMRTLLLSALAMFGPAISQAQTLSSERLTYTARNTQTYTLNAVRGHFVTIGFPDNWLDTTNSGFDTREARQFVDLCDLAYLQFKEVVGGEPGQGPFPQTRTFIAIVETGDKGGWGWVGSGRIELSRNSLAATRDAVRRGTITEQVLHEMAHTFDLYHSYILDLYPDSTHAWTEFMIQYLSFRMHIASYRLQADGALADTTRLLTFAWDSRIPAAEPLWSSCIRQGTGCEADGIRANSAWSGFLLRYVQLFGQSSLRKAFDWLADLRLRQVAPPATGEARNDLFVEALARGAGKNTACVFDQWRWEFSLETRAHLQQLFPGETVECSDADTDNYSNATNDPDDHDPARTPNAADVDNGIDDDGDGYVDNLLPSFPQSTAVQLPLRFASSLSGPGDRKQLTFETTRASTWLMRGLSLTKAWGFTVKIVDANLQRTTPMVSQVVVAGQSQRVSFALPRGRWLLQAELPAGLPSGRGSFDIVVVPNPDPDREPSENWLSLSSSLASSGASVVVQPILQLPSSVVARQPRIRYFSSRAGLIIEQQVDSGGAAPAFTWSPVSGELAALRAQLVSEDGTLTYWSAPLSFQVLPSGSSMIPASHDLQLSVRSTLSTSVTFTETVDVVVEVFNDGPDAAPDATLLIDVDPMLTLASRQASQGQFVSGPSSVTAQLGTISPGQRTYLFLSAVPWAAAGRTVTLSSRVSAAQSATDRNVSNNTAQLSINVMTTEVTPYFSQTVKPLPLRVSVNDPEQTLAAGSLCRLTALLPSLHITTAQYGRVNPLSQSWIPPDLGISLTANGRQAPIVSVTPNALVTGNYDIDFMLPLDLSLGGPVGFDVVDTRTGNVLFRRTSAETGATVQLNNPALWRSARAMALALTADHFAEVTATTPVQPGTDVLLFSTGISLSAPPALTLLTPEGSTITLPIKRIDRLGSLPGMVQLLVQIPPTVQGSGRVLLAFSSSSNTESAWLPIR